MQSDTDRTKDEQWLEDAADLPAETVDPWSEPGGIEAEARRRIPPKPVDRGDEVHVGATRARWPSDAISSSAFPMGTT